MSASPTKLGLPRTSIIDGSRGTEISRGVPSSWRGALAGVEASQLARRWAGVNGRDGRVRIEMRWGLASDDRCLGQSVA